MPEYFVEIVKEGDPEEVVKRMGPHSLRTAERIERGADINLNHEDFFTRVVDADGEAAP
jgi:hypothetical protein